MRKPYYFEDVKRQFVLSEQDPVLVGHRSYKGEQLFAAPLKSNLNCTVKT